MIPVAKPWIGEEEAIAVRRPLSSGWVTQGPEVAAFEQEFARFVGAEHAVAVASCTVALHLALRAVGVGPGDEVITASHSYIASANSIRYCGATPVFVDIEPGTFNMNSELIDNVVSKQTRAILAVHQMGMPCNLAKILEVARRHDLPVVEDAACAAGSEVRVGGERWEKIGKPHGDVACFSFHPRKLMTTGDGGMLTTASAELERKFRLWRQHAMSLPDTVRHGAREVVFESYDELGYNYRMTDIQAAVGREQLKRLPAMVQRRRQQVERYREILDDVAGLALPAEADWARSNWQSYCVRLPDRIDQRRTMQSMLEAGVATRRGIMCIHREPAYARESWSCGPGPETCGCAPGSCERLGESERAQNRSIVLPLFHAMTDTEQDSAATALRESCVQQNQTA